MRPRVGESRDLRQLGRRMGPPGGDHVFERDEIGLVLADLGRRLIKFGRIVFGRHVELDDPWDRRHDRAAGPRGLFERDEEPLPHVELGHQRDHLGILRRHGHQLPVPPHRKAVEQALLGVFDDPAVAEVEHERKTVGIDDPGQVPAVFARSER